MTNTRKEANSSHQPFLRYFKKKISLRIEKRKHVLIKKKQGKLLKTTEEALALYKSNYLTLKDKIDKFNNKFWVYVFNLYIK